MIKDKGWGFCCLCGKPACGMILPPIEVGGVLVGAHCAKCDDRIYEPGAFAEDEK